MASLHLLIETCPPLSARGYRCPLCMHSALDMTRYWRQLDNEVAQTPMPTEYQNMMVEVRGQPCLLPWSCASELLAAEGTRHACWIRSPAKGWGMLRSNHVWGVRHCCLYTPTTHPPLVLQPLPVSLSPCLPVCLQILCNDCNARSTVQFHLLGMKCQSCESYNTAQDGRCRLSLEEQ